MKGMNFIVPLVVYPFDVMVSINESMDVFSGKVVRKWGMEILNDFIKRETPNRQAFSFSYNCEGSLCAMIKVDRFTKNNPQDAGTLAHEIFHVCEFVLRLCGVELNSNSHEAYAYLIGYLTTEIYKKIK